MSQQLINRSPDLKRLRDEGYDVAIDKGYLVLRQIPYVDSDRNIGLGTLVSELTLSGDVTARPGDHVAMFAGATPCDREGNVLSKIINSSQSRQLAEGLTIDHTFSSKPAGGYPDYYDKMTTYIRMISGPAVAIDGSVSPTQFPVIPDDEETGVFKYIDTATSRAGIDLISQKLEVGRVAIVGLGGTGSYVLDLVAKTPVHEIHLFDGDRFFQHNAFRSPGAASIEDLTGGPYKVDYHRDRYSNMRHNIISHPYHLDAAHNDELRDMDFVFLCIDRGTDKACLIRKLEEFNLPFIDVGMGIEAVEGQLAGIVRVTMSSSVQRDHIYEKKRIPLTESDGSQEYSQNIQIADLNALNAALAVIKWKKWCGFYRDLDNEYFSAYTIDGNHLTNEDQI